MDPSERYCYNPTLRWNPQVEEYFVKAYGVEHFARISKALMSNLSACNLVLYAFVRRHHVTLIRVNTLKSTSDAVIEKLLAILQERGWQNDPAEGANVPYSSDDIATDQDHTIDYGYKKDKPPKEVIVSRKCAEAVLRGAHVYVPGVLACSAHVEKGETVAVSVSVEQPGTDGGWGVGFTRGTVLQGSQTDPYHFERSGLYIGQGTTMMSRAGMFRETEGVALDMHNRVFNLPSFRDLLEGDIFLQNLPSIIAAHALDPQEGEKILDMCAAPGGKTTAIAILMKDKGEVIAADRSHNKVLDIQKLAAEMGLKCITTYKLDALRSVQRINKSVCQDAPMCGESESIQNSDSLTSIIQEISDTALDCTHELDEAASIEQLRNKVYTSKAEVRKSTRKMRNGPGRNNSLGGRAERSKGFLPNSFDRVLLDAPCSALGLRPRLFAGEDTVESLRTHAKYQRRMFDQAVQLVRPGGVIVYSTCTINPGENEALVRYALDTYKFLSLAAQHPKVGDMALLEAVNFLMDTRNATGIEVNCELKLNILFFELCESNEASCVDGQDDVQIFEHKSDIPFLYNKLITGVKMAFSSPSLMLATKISDLYSEQLHASGLYSPFFLPSVLPWSCYYVNRAWSTGYGVDDVVDLISLQQNVS
ncbi:rRNA (cytosine-C(5))-methyltransferase NOP2C [Sesamum angolense]|uniref:rRNA (Cytosine-C(5))-methyltransferase NOP2C n=1 Tax=Sesamum angolense TaxID=2727404 RepID=A0AAE1WQC2_9LAMI|nr:rRNA (cytosine-C(5))-methyltransferase NOP2C [Sesamum angolense]